MIFAEQLLCGSPLSAQYITQKTKENSPMDRILSKVWNSRYGKYLLPLSFCVGNLINVMFYYLGLAFECSVHPVRFCRSAFRPAVWATETARAAPLGSRSAVFCRLLHQGADELWGYRNVGSSCRSVCLFFISRILRWRLRRSKAAGILVL